MDTVQTGLDVVIIGAGWIGLLACKYAKAHGLTPVVLEKRDDLGGVWNYSDDPELITVMKTTETSSSRTVTEIADFPMPASLGHFPRHQDILAYLRAYTRAFDLERYIHFGHTVERTERVDDRWVVTTDKGTFHARHLLVASGVHQTMNTEILSTLFAGFGGERLHAGQVKEIDARYQGKRVLVYGGGETASDIVELLVPIAAEVTMAIPNGQVFFQKRYRPTRTIFHSLMSLQTGDPLDAIGSPLLAVISPLAKSKPGYALMCRYTTGGSPFAYDGHGIPEWKTKADFFHAFLNKSAAPVQLAQEGRLRPKRKVVSVQGQTVRFCDGSQHDFDVVIACTGYSPRISFFNREIDPFDLYKFIFDPADPSLAFAGIIRPVIFSIPLIAEVQCRFIMKVWSGACKLPPAGAMTRRCAEDREFWADYFAGTSRRIGPLVEPVTYLRQLAQAMSDPAAQSRALFERNKQAFFYALAAPLSGARLLLDDPASDQPFIEHSRTNIFPSALTSVRRVVEAAVLRASGIDRMTKRVADMLYRRDCARRGIEPVV